MYRDTAIALYNPTSWTTSPRETEYSHRIPGGGDGSYSPRLYTRDDVPCLYCTYTLLLRGIYFVFSTVYTELCCVSATPLRALAHNNNNNNNTCVRLLCTAARWVGEIDYDGDDDNRPVRADDGNNNNNDNDNKRWTECAGERQNRFPNGWAVGLSGGSFAAFRGGSNGLVRIRAPRPYRPLCSRIGRCVNFSLRHTDYLSVRLSFLWRTGWPTL